LKGIKFRKDPKCPLNQRK